MQDAPTGPEHVATVVQAQTAREQRDVQRTMEHWRRNTWGPDCIPLLDTFDFSPMRGDWGYRFLICGDGTPENAVFVTYGPKLAQLLGLPERAVVARPFVEQIPESYRSTFVEGYRKAVMEMVPVTLKGTFSVSSTFELVPQQARRRVGERNQRRVNGPGTLSNVFGKKAPVDQLQRRDRASR